MSFDPNDAKSIYMRAVELPNSASRAEYLAQACAGNLELQARVENLLKSNSDPDSLLDRPASDFMETQSVSPDAPPVSLDFLEVSDVPGHLGRLGGHEVLEVIGRGGMGIVLRAMDAKLNRVVAIKVLVPELASQPQARRRFLREAQAAAAVSHDHIVTIHAVDDGASSANKLPFLVMECIVGQSLQQKLDQVGGLGLKEILRIGTQIAAGLAAAHKQGLVHRDIKPANILLENGIERVKITDFGLARAMDDVGITQTGQIAGTPQYMSPEQAMGQTIDQRSDLFSLGSVMYAMATGRPAFSGDSAVAVLRRVCEDTPRPIEEVTAEVPTWLIAIISRLMAKRPEDRFQTAQEVAGLLEQWLAHCQQPEAVAKPAMTEPIEVTHRSTFGWVLSNIVELVLGFTFLTMCAIWAGGGNWTASLAGLAVGALIVWFLHAYQTQQPQVDGAPLPVSKPRGVLGRAWHDWWSERDRWLTVGVQTVLIVVYLVCMLAFVGMGWTSGHDDQGRVTFDYRLGSPTPWFRFEVYPQPLTPFRFGFHPFTSSVLLGLIGCVAYYIYWRIEQVRDPQTSKFNRPAFMLGIWGIGALGAVAFGHYQGYAALARPKVNVSQLATSQEVPDALAASGRSTQPGAQVVEPPETPRAKPHVQVAAAVTSLEAARQQQAATAQQLDIEVEYTNSIGMKLRLIPPGEFTMGTSAQATAESVANADWFFARWVHERRQAEQPQHAVRISQPMYMGIYEVTVGQFAEFVKATRAATAAEKETAGGFAWLGGAWKRSETARWHNPGFLQTHDHPVSNVSWDDAVAFCKWLSDQEGLEYRLPREAEWEYACRAGTTTVFSTGDDAKSLDGFANIADATTLVLHPQMAWAVAWSDGFPFTAPVGSFKPNPLGLHDMHGNVHEWCLDWYDANYYRTSPAIDPPGPTSGKSRVYRGGGWDNWSGFCRSADRYGSHSESLRTEWAGFRVVIVGDLTKVAARARD